MQNKISIVIPTRKENDDSYLLKMAARYPTQPCLEYIVVDRDTPQNVLTQAKRSDFSVLRSELQTRAERLNEGLQYATGAIVIFHHPRSLLTEEAFFHLIENGHLYNWGGFTHKFDNDHPGLRFTSWYSNKVRPRLWKIIYLDHCLFFKRELLNKSIPTIPIFEDTEISKILRKAGAPTILPFISKTSSVRFQKNGFWRQGLKNQWLKLAYFAGQSPRKMNDFYEKHLNLN